jgi:hypothetical protein
MMGDSNANITKTDMRNNSKPGSYIKHGNSQMYQAGMVNN